MVQIFGMKNKLSLISVNPEVFFGVAIVNIFSAIPWPPLHR
jgi:hypothetical protein